MDNLGDSNLLRLGSSVCEVCQGLGDLRNPRGAVVDTPEGRRGFGYYLYIYMHHPSVAALLRSAEGCSICTVLCHGLRSSNAIEFSQAADALAPAPTNASTHAKSDDEVATCLAERVKSKNSFERSDLADIGKGRIILRHYSNDELGLRGTTGKFVIEADVLNNDSLYGVFSGFQNSCRSISQNN